MDDDMTHASKPGQRPRIALMGEFSAGKSTLTNLLLGEQRSPVKVAATQLPPVWYSFGAPKIVRVGLTGEAEPIAPGALMEISPTDTQMILVSLETEILEYCDLIDMPGISDPNMPAEVWQRALARADGVIWCTPATQAWRQTEAAIWEEVRSELWERSILLITRMDKILKPQDKARVTARLRRETGELFRSVCPISLTEAMEGRQDEHQPCASGFDDFAVALIELVEELKYTDSVARRRADPIFRPVSAPDPVTAVMKPPANTPRRVAPHRPKAEGPRRARTSLT